MKINLAKNIASVASTLVIVSLVLASGCSKADACADTGGVWNADNRKCDCWVEAENGYCDNNFHHDELEKEKEGNEEEP